MTDAKPITLALPDPDATARVGAALARALRPGDSVLLSGPLGAGKTALARAVIAARLGAAQTGAAGDIPSPTYTLTQVYEDDAGEIWHADLYRLTDPAQVWELGLTEAFDAAICLVEWPERLGPLAPRRALIAALDFDAGEGRILSLTPQGAGWEAALDAARAA
ncbi:MAG: tRNA (adenosine(37)-N6)-threonylcarbamoyltransferase complex ATPase subunit type 1 TsaE [Rhodobacterales bacterium CG_4_9_14_3_um_filter_71_31]|nr:MAG: tRNA (adenosine(37)-N6)-threonylcarbamoyltransferase complex ATPase subunit type 1 TsaE [Rhodobacterales bacterium CG_4_9_14_3_um_filter_71_31]